MGKTRTFNKEIYPCSRTTLTIQQVKDYFLEDNLSVVKRCINNYRKLQKELEKQTEQNIAGFVKYYQGQEKEVWILLEEVSFNKTNDNIERHIKRLQRFLPTTPSKNGVTDEQIEQAKLYPIQDLLSSYGFKIRHNMCQCPFHDDDTPSMSIKYNRFNCFGCGKKGDTIELVRSLENLSFIEAVRKLI